MTVPGKPGLVHLKSYSEPGLPLESVTDLGVPVAPLAKTRMPWGTRMCISAVKRSVM